MSSNSLSVLASTQPIPYVTALSDGTHTWLADEPVSVGGTDTGPSPFQLLLSSLGACTAITLRMYAARKQWPLEDVVVDVRMTPGTRDTNGATLMERHIELRGPLDLTQRARLLEIANACPVHKILTNPIQIQSQLIEGLSPQALPIAASATPGA